MRARILVPVVAVVGLLLAGAPAHAQAARSATVVRVVDGDTVRIAVGGRTGTIDLIGVRAPTGRQCFAAASAKALRGLLPGRSRISVADEAKVAGRGRYVTRNGRLVNAELLRRGGARLGALARVGRAASLRAAERTARAARRGLHGACGAAVTPAPSAPAPVPEVDGPAAQFREMRGALAGVRLVDVFTDTNSSTRNETRFCADGRSQRNEEFLSRDAGAGPVVSAEAGSWAVTNTVRQADGSLLAEVVVRADRPDFETRVLQVVRRTDGTVQLADRASQAQPDSTPCAPPAPQGGLDNDSATARDGLLAALTGARVTAGGRDSDICPGGRLVRREGGQVVADGAAVVEWAVADQTGRIGVLRVEDATRGRSRRILVALAAAGSLSVGELGRGNSGTTPATRGAPVC